MNVHARIRLGPVLALCAMLVVAGFPSASQAAEGNMCWAPDELQHRPREARIRKNVREAFIPLPEGEAVAPRGGNRRIEQTVVGRDYVKAIRRVNLPDNKKYVALTFDLCEQPYEIAGYQGDLVDYLRAEGIHATFFAGGKWMMTHPKRARQLMADSLFELANHAWEHRNMRVASPKRVHDEIHATQLAYERVRKPLAETRCLAPNGEPAAQIAPRRMNLFRFPFGACNAAALQEVADQGLLAIQWDVSSADPDRSFTGRRMARSVLGRVRPGSIVLFHANGRGHHTADGLPRIVSELRSRGYRFLKVSDLLNLPEAEWVTSPLCYDSRKGDTNRYDALARRLERRYQQFYVRVGAHSAQPATLDEDFDAPLPDRNPQDSRMRRSVPEGRPIKRNPSSRSWLWQGRGN